MNPRIACLLMCSKSIGLGLLVCVMPLAPVVAHAETTDADTARQLAVSQYIEGATKELDVYRQQITAASRPENQQQIGEAKSKLAECDRLVKALKSADADQFDPIKSAYERARAEMIRALQAAQKT
jgi:hypothetical protein